MRVSSLFPAVVTAITAAGFALTEPAPLAPGSATGLPTDVEIARIGPSAMLLAAFDPLALSPRFEADVH